MKERPILFQGAMVRALLAGTKTQTRRAWRVQPPPGVPVGWVPGETKQPYGWPGDRLWVRETWAYHVHAQAAQRDEDGPFVYAADGQQAVQMRLCDRWRPSIHMPRAASRLTLEVTGVRAERLQAISEADARAEGVTVMAADGLGQERYLAPGSSGEPDYWVPNARLAYSALWAAINGAGSWDANPWVWVVEFRPLASPRQWVKSVSEKGCSSLASRSESERITS